MTHCCLVSFIFYLVTDYNYINQSLTYLNKLFFQVEKKVRKRKNDEKQESALDSSNFKKKKVDGINKFIFSFK